MAYLLASPKSGVPTPYLTSLVAEIVAVSAQEVTGLQIQLDDSPAADAPVYDPRTYEPGPLSPEVARRPRYMDRVIYALFV
jgi:hypothetical protein